MDQLKKESEEETAECPDYILLPRYYVEKKFIPLKDGIII